jgi:predicted phosphodiesterase
MKFPSRIPVLVAIAAGVIVWFPASASAGSDFWFAQITDTHWGKDDNLERTKKAVGAINSLPVEVSFVVHTGDITDRSANGAVALENGLAILKELKYPVYFVPGNNDIPKNRFKEASADFAAKFGGVSKLTITPHAAVITLFDFPGEAVDAKTAPDPIGVLDSLLKLTSRDLPVLVFQHFPITDDLFDEIFHGGWSAQRKSKFAALCEEHHVAAVICGHFHRDELNWIGTIPEFIAPPIAAKMGRQASFRLYHFENGRISYFTEYF